MDSIINPIKQGSGLERWIRYLAGLLIVTNLLFENNSSALPDKEIFLYYLITGIVFIILTVLLIPLPKDSKFVRVVGILACLAMIMKDFYQASLFL